MQPRERITLEPAYVLHHREYRDTSRILDVFTRAPWPPHAVRARRARPEVEAGLAADAVPSAAGVVERARRCRAAHRRPSRTARRCRCRRARCCPASISTSSIISLTTRHDPQPQLFDDYARGAAAAVRRAAARADAARVREAAAGSRSATASSSRSTRGRTTSSAPRRDWPKCARTRPARTRAAACWPCSEETLRRRASRSTSRAACCARRWIIVSKAASCARAPWRVRWRGEDCNP